MLIDWFTVSAQVLNFLVLVWLMKRFLYQPILDAIDAREKLIATQLADADAKKVEATRERDEFQQKITAFESERATLLTKATDEAESERQRLMEAAHQAADAASVQRRNSLQSEAQNLNQELVQRTQDEVFAIARKTLGDLASTSLEQRASEVFTNRLRDLDSETKAKLTAALNSASDPALVRSAFDLPTAERTAIQTALNETFDAQISVRFETAPELVGGIELTANGQKVAWSIAEYLVSMQEGVGELLQVPTKP